MSNTGSQKHRQVLSSAHVPNAMTHLLWLAGRNDGHGRSRALQAHPHSSLGSPRPCSYPAGCAKMLVTCHQACRSASVSENLLRGRRDGERRGKGSPVTTHSYVHQAEHCPRKGNRQQRDAHKVGGQERGLRQVSGGHGRQT